MLSLTKQNNSIYVEGTDHSLFPYNGVVSLPLNSVIVVTDESDIVTFRSASNYDVLFSGRIDEITINGQGVTKEDIGSVFGSAFNVAGGGGGLTPEQEEKLNNAVQIADYNADKEAQATIDESQNAAIEGLSGDIEGKQDKIDDLDAIREGAEKGATALQEETDPIWNAEKGNYYTKGETDGLVGEAKASANTAISIASSAEGIATAAHSRADEALEELEKKADKTWVEGKGYLTEETDPTVPAHVKAITEENIAKWNEGGKTGEVVGNNEAPKDNVGIGIFTEGEVDLEVGSLVYDGDWLVVEDANDFIIVGNDDFGTGWKFWHNSLNSGGFDNKSKYYTTDMVEIPYNEVSSNWDSFKYIHLRPDFVGHEGRIVSEVKNVKKLSSTEGGVYIYDGTEEPSKVATEKTLEGFVDVETYNKHITDQTAVDEAQNSAIEGIEGDITRIDSKIDDIELFKFPNATIIGEPTIQSGQVSNFSTENYLQFPFVLDLHNQPFQIDFCFTTSTDVSGQQNVLDSKFGIALAIKDGKGLMAISSNGTSWNIGSVIGTMNIEPNTTYYARLTWDGIQYKTFLSTDGSIYTQDMVLVGAQRPFPTNIYIGGCDLSVTGHEAHPFKGTINMNKAQLTVMGNVIWQGMDDAGLATRLATNLNNIDEVGKERIKEIVGTIPTKTSELVNDSSFVTEQWVGEQGYKKKDDYWNIRYNHNTSGYLNISIQRNGQNVTTGDVLVYLYSVEMGMIDILANYDSKSSYWRINRPSNKYTSIRIKYSDGNGLIYYSSYIPYIENLQPKGDYATKDEIPSLDGYATEQWVGEQGYLTEHQPLKTINGETIVGDGNITIESGGDVYGVYINYKYASGKIGLLVYKNGEIITTASVSVTLYNKSGQSSPTVAKTNNWYNFSYYSNSVVAQINISDGGKTIYGTVIPLADNYQTTLTSGTNIKTINGESILGSGDLVISGGGGDETDPVWTAEKVNYYTKTEVDEMIGNINNALAKLING